MTFRMVIAFSLAGVILAFAHDSLHFGPWATFALSAFLIYIAGILTIPGAREAIGPHAWQRRAPRADRAR